MMCIPVIDQSKKFSSLSSSISSASYTPFLMQSMLQNHTSMISPNAPSLSALKKAGVSSLSRGWLRSASRSLRRWESRSCWRLGLFRWWGWEGTETEQQWMILARRQTNSSLFYSRTPLSLIRTLKFSWFYSTTSLISHFYSSLRYVLPSRHSISLLSFSSWNILSLTGRVAWLTCSPVPSKALRMASRWSLTRFSSKLVRFLKSWSRSSTLITSDSSMRLVLQQVSSSNFSSRRRSNYYCGSGGECEGERKRSR